MQSNQIPVVVKPLMVRLGPEAYQWVQQQAAQQERSANWIVGKAVEEARKNAQSQEAAQCTPSPSQVRRAP
ncbi:hypothetical protein LJR039_005454 [Pseudorhodoferax sp. LjRoot39]|uniref:hypothetical protein n=1 Tax=Pseudorhodoferax sp. LjRoot39 TaxID=3342328 RepID=UPI003ECD0895